MSDFEIYIIGVLLYYLAVLIALRLEDKTPEDWDAEIVILVIFAGIMSWASFIAVLTCIAIDVWNLSKEALFKERSFFKKEQK